VRIMDRKCRLFQGLALASRVNTREIETGSWGHSGI
jgi:hypothetical protein